MDISIVIPTLNEGNYVEACLKAIRSQRTDREYEVIVCDGGSDDNTIETVKGYADKIVEIDVRSIGIGRNSGAKKAESPYLLFVDADTLLPVNYIDKTMEKFENDKELIAFCSSFQFSDEDKKLTFIRKALNSYLSFRDKVGLTILLGFNTAVRKDIFKAIDGFRDVPLEDGDFGYRMRKKGKTGFFTDFHVITSSRRLKGMGTLGTIRYYLEMDLALRHPDIRNILAYSDYVSCREEEARLQIELSNIFEPRAQIREIDSSLRGYIQDKADNLLDILPKDRLPTITREQFANRITNASRSIAELKLRSVINREDVDRAVSMMKRGIMNRR